MAEISEGSAARIRDGLRAETRIERAGERSWIQHTSGGEGFSGSMAGVTCNRNCGLGDVYEQIPAQAGRSAAHQGGSTTNAAAGDGRADGAGRGRRVGMIKNPGGGGDSRFGSRLVRDASS